MKPYTLTIRFRETDEYEAEVGDFMKNLSDHTDKSKNKFVIDLIAKYMKRSDLERRENAFIERLRKMIRKELEAFAFTVPFSRFSNTPLSSEVNNNVSSAKSGSATVI